MGTLTRRRWAVLALLAMAGAHGMLHAAEPLEYAVKAAYLSKFPFYVEWPASAFAGLNSPITLCIAGEDPFGPALDDAVTGQQVQGHAIVVRRLRSVTRESGCHIVYIAGDARVEHLRGSNALVVTDGPSPGAIISFEFHYHPNGESEAVDATKVGIKFWPRGYKPKHLVSTRGISSSDQLIIPPNEVARSDSYFQLQQPARLVSYQPHGHYRLSHMKLEAILPSGEVQVITDVPHFVWTWQITYPYKYQPAYPKGTVLHSIAWHDNTAANKENPDPTAFVGGGARTVDEMNIGWLDFYYINDDEYAQVSKEQQEREKAKAASTNQQ